MADQRTYRVQNMDLRALAQEVANFFQSQSLEVQVLDAPGGVMVQSRAQDFIKKYAVGLTITVTQQGENVLVQAGNAKWAMNAVSAVASTIIFWPLLALPIYTSYKQKQLIDDTWGVVERYMLSIGATPAVVSFTPPPMPVAPAAAAAPAAQPAAPGCPHCGQPLRPGSKFCDSCGKPVEMKCAQCGAELRPGAKFCDKCGQAVS